MKRNGDLLPSLADDLFEGTFLTPRLFDLGNKLWGSGMTTPRANVMETNNEFKIELSAPGLKKGDFKIEVENGALTISCEKEEETKDKDKDKKYTVREYSYSSFSRTFQLPENVKDEQIDAKYEDGVLRLTIPKKETSINKPKKQIKIA